VITGAFRGGSRGDALEQAKGQTPLELSQDAVWEEARKTHRIRFRLAE